MFYGGERELHKVITSLRSIPHQGLVMVTIFLNTVTLALEHHDMNPDLKHMLDIANIVFLVIFGMEMVFKQVG